MESLLQNPDIMQTQRRDITVLFCDLRGSTALAESVDPEVFVAFTNDYFSVHTEIIMRHRGALRREDVVRWAGREEEARRERAERALL